jgi:hypothetical protein
MKKTLGRSTRKLVRLNMRPDVNRYSDHESLCLFGVDLQRDRSSVISNAGIKLDFVTDWWVVGHQWNGNFFVWLQCSTFACESGRKNILQKYPRLVG